MRLPSPEEIITFLCPRQAGVGPCQRPGRLPGQVGRSSDFEMHPLRQFSAAAIPLEIVLEEVDKFFRVDVLMVRVGSRRHETEDIFGHEDGEEPGERGAGDGGHEQVSTGFDEFVERAKELGGPIDVFEHLHGADDVERAVLRDKVFGGGVQVREAGTAERVRAGEERIASSVRGGNANVGGTRIDARCTCA